MQYRDSLEVYLGWGWGEFLSDSSRKVEEHQQVGEGLCLPWAGLRVSQYLKDGGHGFIQVIIVTWLLEKDVS